MLVGIDFTNTDYFLLVDFSIFFNFRHHYQRSVHYDLGQCSQVELVNQFMDSVPEWNEVISFSYPPSLSDCQDEKGETKGMNRLNTETISK